MLAADGIYGPVGATVGRHVDAWQGKKKKQKQTDLQEESCCWAVRVLSLGCCVVADKHQQRCLAQRGAWCCRYSSATLHDTDPPTLHLRAPFCKTLHARARARRPLMHGLWTNAHRTMVCGIQIQMVLGRTHPERDTMPAMSAPSSSTYSHHAARTHVTTSPCAAHAGCGGSISHWPKPRTPCAPFCCV